MDFNSIPIDYSTLKNKDEKNPKRKICPCLYEQYPPKHCWKMDRIDPFCYEIRKIVKSHNLINNNNKGRFITYRHNLRAIANAALSKLTHFRIYEKCGINIGVYRNGKDIILENVSELEVNEQANFNKNGLYGYLLEHALESLATADTNSKHLPPMEYQKCLKREETRALNELVIGEDIVCLCAAEMDAMMGKNKVIEIKCRTIQYGNRRYTSKIPEMNDAKLLKYWTQCRFGGVDSVVIAFHKNGIVQKTKTLTTEDMENMFPVITNKCIAMVHDVLKWLQKAVVDLPDNQLHLLSFDTKKQNNTTFILRRLRSKETEMKFFQMAADKNEKIRDKLLSRGLVMNVNHKQLEIRKV